jgi:hypothetical protein
MPAMSSLAMRSARGLELARTAFLPGTPPAPPDVLSAVIRRSVQRISLDLCHGADLPSARRRSIPLRSARGTMPALPSDPYVTSLEEVFWGGVLVAITMAMHGFGMPIVLRLQGALRRRFEKTPSFAKGILILILASWSILLVHLLEVLVWAAFFLWKGALPTASLAYYFSLNEYTTVGSAYSLPLPWRLLEGMIAMAGLLTFAWSTGILFTLAQDFQAQQMKLLELRRARRAATLHKPKQP